MYKYCPIYIKDALPVIEEGDIFNLTIRHEPEGEPLNEYEISLISFLKDRPGSNRNDIENTLDISLATLKRTINSLQKRNLILRIGSRKTGGYFLIAKDKTE